MTHTPDFTEENFDDFVVAYFPYPVAIAYKEMLKTTDKERQADCCFNVFNFAIRTVTLALIIRYLREQDLNVPELNALIEDNLANPYPAGWIKILKATLNAYEGKPERFFIQELYTLYWEPAEDSATKESPWELLDAIATIEANIKAGSATSPNKASIATELIEKIRQFLRYFYFFGYYELWLVGAKEGDWLDIDIYRGDSIGFTNVQNEDIAIPPYDSIQANRFYITKKHEDKYFLLELNPLLIDPQHIFSDITERDTGVFGGYYPSVRANIPPMLHYLLMIKNFERKTTNNDLVALFTQLYKDQLGNKIKDSAPPLDSFSWTHLKGSFEKFSKNHLEVVEEKYHYDAYVERQDLTAQLLNFIDSTQTAMIITGGVGVGKTNLLYHFYENNLVKQTTTATLWLNGISIDAEHSLSYSLLFMLHKVIEFDQPPPTSNQEADLALHKLLQRPELLGHKVVVIIDALNENQDSIEVFQQVNDFINFYHDLGIIKVVITSRPQTWQYIRQYKMKHFRKACYYRGDPQGRLQASDQDNFVLQRFTLEETAQAFERYSKKYKIQNTRLQNLQKIQDAMREPLIMALICEGREDQGISSDYAIEDIIPTLRKKQLGDQSNPLTMGDFALLEDWIVPQFLSNPEQPVNVLTRTQLHEVVFDKTTGTTLNDKIANVTFLGKDSAGRNIAFNQSFENLRVAGWLEMTGAPDSYEIRFRYEYYFDYWVGQHLLKLFNDASDKMAFFSQWVDTLQKSPFLWGALRNLLVVLFLQEMKDIQGGTKKRPVLITELAQTNFPMQRDLVVSVLIEYYDDCEKILDSLLPAWLQSPGLAPEVAVLVAVSKKNKACLVNALGHKDENLMLFTVATMSDLWRDEAGTEFSIACFEAIVDKVRLRKLGRNIKYIKGLLGGSLVMIMRDYATNRRINDDLLRALQQRVWKPIIYRLFRLIPFSPKVRRWILSFGIGFAIELISMMENAGQIILSMKDLRLFFAADEARRAVFDRMLPHITAASQADDLEPLETFAEYLKPLIIADHDYLTSCVGLVTLTAHLFADPDKTSVILRDLIGFIEENYPETTDPAKPTAPPWLPMIAWPLSNLPYKEMPHEQAARLLELYCDIILIIEKRYLGAVLLKSGNVERQSFIGDGLVYCYELDLPLGYAVLKDAVNAAIARKDHSQINQYVNQLCEMMTYHSLPEASLAALHHMIILLQDYIKELSADEQQEFWDNFVNSLVSFGTVSKHLLVDFVGGFEEAQLPSSVRNSIRTAQPQQSLGYKLAEAGLLFSRHALTDKNPTALNLLHWIFARSLEVKNLRQWVLELVVFLSNLVYGEKLFATDVDYSSELGSSVDNTRKPIS
ncbi:hypothetical protein ACFLYO_01270 [Chloroflexota bacterium]